MWKLLRIGSRSIFWILRRTYRRYSENVDPLPTRYGGKTNITVLPGVGVGPDIMEKTLEILQAAQAPLFYEILQLTPDDTEEGKADFKNALISIKRNKVALKANIEVKSRNPNVESRNVLLRKSLDLFAYVLRCKTYPNLLNRFGEIDIVLIRQNTQGEYLMLEHEPAPGTIENLKIITRHASERLAMFAFNYALENNRKHITVMHSTYTQGVSEGLFLEAVLKVSKKFPQIRLYVKDVVNVTINIVMNPQNYDVILTTNLSGSMISNVLIGMVGGPGLSSGVNLGEDNIAVFEPGARNKGSSLKERNVANPIAMVMAAIDLLNHLNYRKTSQLLEHAVYATLVQDRVRTKDLGGKATTDQMTENVIRHVKKQLLPATTMMQKSSTQEWKEYCDVPENFKPTKKS